MVDAVNDARPGRALGRYDSAQAGDVGLLPTAASSM